MGFTTGGQTRQRIRTYAPSVTGGGGGTSTPIVGPWGPDFGEAAGSDGVTTRVGINATNPQNALAATKVVGINATNPTNAMTFDPAVAGKVGIHVSGSVLGAPFFQSISPLAQTANSASVVINAPSGIVSGDLLIAAIGSTSISSAETFTTIPSGWTLIKQTNNVGALGANLLSYYKIAGSSEPSSYTWSGGQNVPHIAWIMRFTGTDPTTPINVSADATGSAVSPVAPTITTTVVNCMKICCCAQQNTLAASYTPPTGYLEESDLTSTNLGTTSATGESAIRVQATAGASGTATMTSTQLAASSYCAQHIAIAPGAVTI